MIIERIGAALAGMRARSEMARQMGGEHGWQPVVRPGMFVPLQMCKRGTDGQWIYRDPTEAEIKTYLETEAW